MRIAVAPLAAAALVLAAGCGDDDKAAYCTERSNLENAVKDLPSTVTSGGVSGLKSQLTTISGDVTSLVSSAKSDFPSETSAMTSSLDALQAAVEALSSSPSATQIATIASDASQVVDAVNGFVDATKSACD